MDFKTRKQQLINQVNIAKAELTDAQTQVTTWKAKCKGTEVKITSTLGAIALCDEAIEDDKKEKSPIPEDATESDKDEEPENIDLEKCEGKIAEKYKV